MKSILQSGYIQESPDGVRIRSKVRKIIQQRQQIQREELEEIEESTGLPSLP